MKYFIIGLGNPGETYRGTRHSVGRATVEHFSKKNGFPELKFDKEINALIAEGKIEKQGVTLLLPETFMNKSGETIKKLHATYYKLQAEQLIVIHDDLDLPLGVMKISFNRGSGGHSGVESIARALKTREFIRVRIGISPKKKPQGEKKVNDFILGHFKPLELTVLKKVMQKGEKALVAIVMEGKERAMNEFN